MTLSRDEIIAAIAARNAEVVHFDVPEWGGEVCIKKLNAGDVEQSGLTEEGGKGTNIVPRVIAVALTDDSGEPLFSEDDVAELAKADVAVAAIVFAEILRVNGLTSEDLDEAVQAFTNAQPTPSSSS